MVHPPFVCELCHAYDPVSKGWTAGVAVKLVSGDGCRAFLREIPDRIWRTFCFVMLRMESDGRCVVTEEELAADMQINKTHAGKRLKELAEWRFNGASLLEPSEAGYSFAASPGTLPQCEEAGQESANSSVNQSRDEPPTTQDLIRELTRKFHKIPRIEVLRGNYSLVGRALNTYGYEAVSEAIDDLSYEFDLREELGEPVPANGEIAKILMQRAAWNKKAGEPHIAGRPKESIWDHYGWNEKRDQLVPLRPDPPYAAQVIGSKIVIRHPQREEVGPSAP